MLPEEDWVHCTVSVSGASCTISHDAAGPCVTLSDMLESIVKPTLKGLGFSAALVDAIEIGEHE